MTLKQTLQSLKFHSALLHYNIATLEQFKAGIESVKKTSIPLIFGVSEGERKYLDIKNVKLGDEVVLIGKSGKSEVSVDDMAYLADTINYEIVTRLNPLIKRIVV